MYNWSTLKKLIWLYAAKLKGGASDIIKTITGNLPLVLQNAIQHSIKSLTRYGLCTQDGTPAPDAHVDIMCNNGALKWDSVNQRVYADGTPEVLTVSGANLLNPATNITGKYITASGSISNGDDAQYTDLIPVNAGETYVCSFVSGRNSGTNRLHGYNANGGWVKQLAYVSASGQQGAKLAMAAKIDSGISYVRLSYGINDTEAMIERADTTEFYESKSISRAGCLINTTEKIQSPYSGANRPGFLVKVTPGSTYYVFSDVKRNGNKVAAGNTDIGFYASIEDVTNVSSNLGNVVSDTFTAPPNANYAVVCFNAGPGTEYEYTFSFGVALCIDYQPYVPPQTASVPMLLGVGDYKDEADLISGLLTHKVGIKVFDGTETFSKSSAYGKAFLLNAAYAAWGADKTKAVLCTHFLGLPQKSSAQDDNTCFFNSTGHFYFRVTDNSDTDAFKAWLAAQYAAGTPVIVFFVLAEETTESVTPQPLHTNEGDNVVSVTANVSPIQLSAEYAILSEAG